MKRTEVQTNACQIQIIDVMTEYGPAPSMLRACNAHMDQNKQAKNRKGVKSSRQLSFKKSSQRNIRPAVGFHVRSKGRCIVNNEKNLSWTTDTHSSAVCRSAESIALLMPDLKEAASLGKCPRLVQNRMGMKQGIHPLRTPLRATV